MMTKPSMISYVYDTKSVKNVGYVYGRWLKCGYVTSSETPIIFPLFKLPVSVLITTIEVRGSCLDVVKCIDDVLFVPPPPPLVPPVVLIALFVEDIDFTLLVRPKMKKTEIIICYSRFIISFTVVIIIFIKFECRAK